MGKNKTGENFTFQTLFNTDNNQNLGLKVAFK